MVTYWSLITYFFGSVANLMFLGLLRVLRGEFFYVGPTLIRDLQQSTTEHRDCWR